MPYDPTLPAQNSPVVSQELRDQFNALKALIDAQDARIAALEAKFAAVAGLAQMNLPFHDLVAQGDMQPVVDQFNGLLTALQT